MKFKTSLLAPLYSAMVLIVAAGCTDEIENKIDPNRPQGNGIVFGASASYIGEPNTRTAYGDYDNNDPDQAKSQEILWLSDDRVEVYSPTSPTKKQVEYQITGLGTVTDHEGDEGMAYLAAYNGQDGLQWDFSSTTQNFYAVYPSPASITNQGMVQTHNIRLENGILHGFIPTNQEYQFTEDANEPGGWKCTPTMDWQYMVARIDDFPVPTNGEDGGISLAFKPLVTTLEITLQGPSAPLAQLNIEASEGDIIMGKFSCDLTAGDAWASDYLPTCTAEQTGTTTNYVTVNLYDTTGNPITLERGQYLTINVFLLPNKDWTNLQVRLAGYNMAAKTMNLSNVTLPSHKKTRVKLQAPDAMSGTNEWISALNNNVLVSQLSIPGTANSFSYEYTGSNSDWYQAQTVDFDAQWNAGIRCFELKCPEPNSDNGNLGNVTLQCNRTNLNYTFKQAVDDIWEKVKDSNEFAIIIPAYESGTGHPSGGTGVRRFATALNNFYDANNSTYEYITYGRNVTVGDARGKLMFIARITSEEDEDVIDNIAPHQGVFVKGWGSLKDLWKRRGYGTQNWADYNNNFSSSIEYSMINSNHNENYSFTMPSQGNNDFYHATVRADGSETSKGAYIQDWNRVSPESKNYALYTHYTWSLSSYRASYTQYAYWPESFTEKCNDVWETFMAAIEDNAGHQGEAFYINSLDGFYIDENIPLSYTPYIAGGGDSYTDQNGNSQSFSYTAGGTAGNINAYAEAINQDFFNRIQNYGVTNIYGPMNIVLLDRVYQGGAGGTDPGSRLPSTIINNNFRFPLLVKEDVTTNTNSLGTGGSSMGNGGNAIQ